ncbi:RagB/SusD family nutrient uptake outer membrane protein [Niabella drilacis]|nr:RagB/SusD family nutrient uptake outer membrane protein [Niabella drilacis]
MKLRYIKFNIKPGLLFIAVLFLLALGSCKKALDTAPDGKISLDEVFADHDKTGAYLNNCYGNIPLKGLHYFFWSRGPVEWCDDAWDTDAEAESWIKSGRMYNGVASAASHPILEFDDARNGAYWDRYWNSIYMCSYFLSRIDKATVRTEVDRKRWAAEAHLLRAYYYSELLKWFGAVLPIEREPFSFTTDFSKLKKASYYEVVKFIIEDCDAALATAELPWRITTGAQGERVTKAMAEAIKSKMILFAASPLNNGGQNYWQEAYQINKIALQNLRDHGYALYTQVNFPQTYLSDVAFIGPDKDPHAALYNEYFNQAMDYTDQPVDKETIYQLGGGGPAWITDGIGAQAGYKSGTCPSQELVDAYETKDGQPILNLSNPYLDEQHLLPNYNTANTLYNPQDPYSNRDPRFYATIYYNGSKRNCWWGFNEVAESAENFPGAAGQRTRIIATWMGEPQTGLDATVRSKTRTGYYERKFLHPNSGENFNIEPAPAKLFRLGEVLLNFAEAAANAGQTEDAYAAVNEIRSRVGMPGLPTGLSQAELIVRVQNERRVELALEENRYFDVRRWTTPGGDLSKTDKWITAAAITRNPNGSYTYGRRTVRSTPRACYTNKFLWVPIPLNEASRLLGSTGQNWQNPGW